MSILILNNKEDLNRIPIIEYQKANFIAFRVDDDTYEVYKDRYGKAPRTVNWKDILSSTENILCPRYLNSKINIGFEDKYTTLLNRMNLFNYQKEILLDPYKDKIIQSVRMSGKTKMIEADAICRALSRPCNIIIMSSNMQNTSRILKDILNTIDELTYSQRNKVRIISFNGGAISFSNGSHIIAYTGRNCLTGMSIDYFMIDEFFNDIPEGLLNCRDIINAYSTTIISTRRNRSKKDLFWNAWTSGKFKKFTISSKDCKELHDKLGHDLKEVKKVLSRREYENSYTIRN